MLCDYSNETFFRFESVVNQMKASEQYFSAVLVVQF